MDEKRISKAEFDAAVDQVMKKMIEDPKLEGMWKILIPITGAHFAAEMSEILFSKEETKEDAE